MRAFSDSSHIFAPLKIIKLSNRSVENYAPFEIKAEDYYLIKAEVELLPEYIMLFAKHGYEPNGYCWEGHIIQILEKVNPALLNHIEFDPEAGGFYAVADSEASQLAFVHTLSPIFQDMETLEEYIRTADRARLDD
ncbi:Imm51 family immunity protein [Siphonobacter sp.]|uniref:Imm51 family immunity protein n=1 Tax=Siphonobacter sp. TaxID=1869184 RepID=UPI003B3B1831